MPIDVRWNPNHLEIRAVRMTTQMIWASTNLRCALNCESECQWCGESGIPCQTCGQAANCQTCGQAANCMNSCAQGHVCVTCGQAAGPCETECLINCTAHNPEW